MRIETIGNCGEELNIGMGGDRPFLLLKGRKGVGRICRYRCVQEHDPERFVIVLCCGDDTVEGRTGRECALDAGIRFLQLYVNSEKRNPEYLLSQMVLHWRREISEKYIRQTGTGIGRNWNSFVPDFLAIAGRPESLLLLQCGDGVITQNLQDPRRIQLKRYTEGFSRASGKMYYGTKAGIPEKVFLRIDGSGAGHRYGSEPDMENSPEGILERLRRISSAMLWPEDPFRDGFYTPEGPFWDDFRMMEEYFREPFDRFEDRFGYKSGKPEAVAENYAFAGYKVVAAGQKKEKSGSSGGRIRIDTEDSAPETDRSDPQKKEKSRLLYNEKKRQEARQGQLEKLDKLRRRLQELEEKQAQLQNLQNQIGNQLQLLEQDYGRVRQRFEKSETYLQRKKVLLEQDGDQEAGSRMEKK